MEKQIAVSVNDVSMRFNLASEKIDSFKEYCVKRLKSQIHIDEFYALNHITIQIPKGEAFAIVGENGCGKSTLLKIISGIYFPSEGSVSVHGSVAPLIELGAGFDMDLTARENVFLNGAVLGHSKAFMEEHFDEIIDFAELWDFVDVPVKNFSSGMVARLGFSIATMIVPDILIVDEILAVGDFMFQKKCEEKIRSMLEQGATLIFVSHSTEQVKSLCDRAVWIDHGVVQKIGTAEEVCDAYVYFMSHKEKPVVEKEVTETELEENIPQKVKEDSVQRVRYPFINLLKAVALFMIVYDHIVPFNLKGMGYRWLPMEWIEAALIRPFGIIEDFGYLGVCIFFLVSGFVICQGQRCDTAISYLKKRISRIFPALIIATVFLYLFQMMIAAFTGQPTYWAQFNAIDWIKSAFLISYLDTQGDIIFGITWFLVPLVMFYFWSWIFMPVAKRYVSLYITLMLALVTVNFLIAGHVTVWVQNLLRFQSYITIILFGQIIYWIYTKTLTYKRGAIYLVINCCAYLENISIFYPDSFIEGGPLRCANFAYAIGIFLAALMANTRLKDWKIVSFLSEYSMSIYLCHLQIAQLVIPIFIGHVGVTLTVLIVYLIVIISAIVQKKIANLVTV